MKIYVLVDNHAQINFDAEWGLSFFIKFRDKTILFDFGNSDLFIRNAEKLGIDIFNADYYVLSHGHWDHGNGLQFLPKGNLICHPHVFIKRYNGKRYIGLPYTLEEASKKFNLILKDNPYEIDKDILFLGQIPRITEFEAKKTDFTKEDGSRDFTIDDTGIVITTEKGLVVITGCAHSGICNTIEYAKYITGVSKVYFVLGGFHLNGKDKITSKTIDFFKKNNINFLSTSHCTNFSSLVEFANIFNSEPFMSGDIIEI